MWKVAVCYNLLSVAGIDAFWMSNWAGRIIVIILFVGSIYVWTIMFTKAHELRRAMRVSDRLRELYGEEKHPSGLFVRDGKPDACPLSAIYVMGCSALAGEIEARGGELGNDVESGEVIHLERVALNVVRKAIEREMSEQALRLESSMGWLASATTSAPFLGLLGTVMGVMDSFGGMAVAGGAALLSEVAPGISAALLTTVVGLFVAIPSSIGYNHLSGRIRRLCVNMENFSEEFMADIERFYASS